MRVAPSNLKLRVEETLIQCADSAQWQGRYSFCTVPPPFCKLHVHDWHSSLDVDCISSVAVSHSSDHQKHHIRAPGPLATCKYL